jgi:hypothetical protein
MIDLLGIKQIQDFLGRAINEKLIILGGSPYAFSPLSKS